MTKSSSEPSSERSNRILQKVKCPGKKTIIGITIAIATLGVGSYWSVQALTKDKLPPFLEAQLSKILGRPVKIGKVESFSLNSIKFDSAAVPPTATDPDKVTIDEIKVDFNILPLIFQRTLPLDITLVKPQVYVEQAKDGSWLDLNLQQKEEGKQYIYVDLTANVEDGEITAVPFGQSPIEVSLDGSGRYNPAKNNLVEYDVEAAIAEAKATIQGQTVIDTGKTDTKLLIDDLSLTELTSLLPNSPVNLNSGKLNADLDVNIPSFAEIAAANIDGTVSLTNLQGEVESISQPIDVESQLRFRGKTARVQDTQAILGDIVARIKGGLSWQEGYDLKVNILPFSLNSLEKIIPVEIPVELAGEVAAGLQLTGEIKDPQLTGTINNTKTVTVEKTQFKQIKADFVANLQKFVLENLQITPLAGGQVTGKGIIETRIQTALENNQAIDATKMPLSFTWQAKLPTESMVNPYYRLPSEVEVGTLTAQGEIGGTLNQPDISLQWQIPEATTAKETISGEGKVFLQNQNLLLRDTEINIGEGKVTVKGSGNLDRQTWQTAIAADSVYLTPFLSQLQTAGVIFSKPITLEGADINLSGRLDDTALDRLTGKADLTLNVDGSDLVVDSNLNSGQIDVTATTSEIALNKYLPNLPLPATIDSSRLEVRGKLEQLLSLGTDPNLSSVRATVNADVTVAEGTVQAQGQLNNNQWQGNIDANNLDSSLLISKLSPSQTQIKNLEDLNAEIDLAGSINPLLQNETYFPIAVNRVNIQSGQQSVAARGNLTFENLTSQPDIARVNLDVNANVDFDSLPLEEVIAQAGNNNQLLAEQVNITGDAAFVGQLQGKNLLSAPTAPGNLSLTGDLQLTDFAFNNVEFEPVLAGDIIVKPAERIALNLRGNQDVIAVAVEPCTASRCRFPYLPTGVELRQGEGTAEPIIAEGERQGDRFSLDILNFPLALLNLAPGQVLGIQGPLSGEVSGEVNANLFTLATTGNIEVEQPAVGYIEADKFTADFAYDSDRNLAEVNSASLDLINSKYNFQGGLDLNSGELQGRLSIPQAYIQDILITLRWFQLEDLARLFQTPDYGTSRGVKPQPIQTVDETIAAKLNLLRKIEKQIQATAAARQGGEVPTELDIEGDFTGEILLAGTITNPEIDFQVQGSNWQWQPQPLFVNIVEPLGLVTEETQFIGIEELQLQGEYQNNAVTLETAKVQLEDTLLSVEGTLSAKQQDASFQVENLTIDTIGKFINIPVDVAGTINTQGTLTGTLAQPQLQGQISFADGAYNGLALPPTIVGNYNYNGARLEFQTTKPSWIAVDASVPYPIEPGKSDRLSADVKLGKEAFPLLGIFTQNQLVWVDGAGEAEVQATARLDLNRATPLYALSANGFVNLENATLQLDAFEESLNVTGKITLDNQLVTVETLNGTFAEKNLSVTGSLPILYPVASLDNPLTVKLPPGAINISTLYKGDVEGQVIVTGAALTPIIGGEVSLEDGQAFIPQNESSTQNSPSTLTPLRQNTSNNRQESAFIAQFKDFRVNLNNFDIEQTPLYEISLAGDLTLNGSYPDLNNLRPQGTLYVQQADVDWLSSNFTLVRSRENTIVFTPSEGILNPYLDIELVTEVSDFNNLRLLDPDSTEIPDPISQVGRTQVIKVTLNIDGEAQAILPTLGKDPAEYCPPRIDEPIQQEEAAYTQEELNQQATCVNVAALESGSDRQLLNSPAVELTSTPPRSQGEIVNLLGNEFLSLTEQLQNSNQEQLLEFGVTQFVIAPIQRKVFYKAEDFVVGIGKEIGLDYLRVYPYFEGIYELNRDSSVRTTYDYIFNEVKVEYQLRF
jgi:autotransporter translocation and assembly factor TamB